MKKVQAGGVLLFRESPDSESGWEFLLMKHPDRWDLPKGHAEKGESFKECALREMEEETGIDRSHVCLDPDFAFQIVYWPKYRRYGGQRAEKTLVIFLGHLQEAVELELTEHDHFAWFSWNPPHEIQEQTIDPLLLEAAHFFDDRGGLPFGD